MSEPSKTPPLFKAAEDVIEGEPILTSVEHGLEELFFDHTLVVVKHLLILSKSFSEHILDFKNTVHVGKEKKFTV